jgi:hypothetical protein
VITQAGGRRLDLYLPPKYFKSESLPNIIKNLNKIIVNLIRLISFEDYNNLKQNTKKF